MVEASEGPTVTVLVPTYQRPDRLARTLRGLAGQDPPFSWEVVVVDNDPGRSAESTVGSATVPASLRYLTERRRGAAHARNRGIEAAHGHVVAMLDDDVVPQPGWLASIVAPILDGRAGLTGGRVRLDPTVARPSWFDERTVGEYLASWDLGGRGAGAMDDDEVAITANAAFERDLLLRSGGFDAELGPRGDLHYVSDDVQVVRAVRALGVEAWWVPDAVVIHELPRQRLRPTWILRRAYLQGRSDWRVDRATLVDRRLGGARVALSRLASELADRLREGPWRPAVAFHVLCDVVRAVGALVEAASWRGNRTR